MPDNSGFCNAALTLLYEGPALSWLTVLLLGAVLEVALGARRSLASTLFNIGSGAIVLCTICCLPLLIRPIFSLLGQVTGAGWIKLKLFELERLDVQLGAAFFNLLIYDFFFYWWHRCQHNIKPLWILHSVHHSDRGFDITTYMRQHWSEQFLQAAIIIIPMATLFSLSFVTNWIALTICIAWSFATHLSGKLQFGRLSWLITGPQLHRLHHSRYRQHQNHNYAAFFPIWDVIFGTYLAPKKNEFPPVGLQS